MKMIDENGYRPNVGIVVINSENRLFWGRRVGQDGWQFPQGGIKMGESPEDALYRELYEEVGLKPEHVEILGSTRGWLKYQLPKRCIRSEQKPLCIGQKQKWFLLRLVAQDNSFNLDSVEHPEFDEWRWVDYWDPIGDVIYFKKSVYRKALCELSHLGLPQGIARRLPDQYRLACRT
ncbi:MAG: RNA pyrophosphohydrolase [Thiotrichales bacterium]|nr:RNA pyrophosphohydrolase [Thiotrichales bacterium]MBT3613395.1 RNA pyrophosphohydrolase [Thiotrichales bacterium]MBT3752494.1 RNA pyrophosphohydrolase [Thiotrichales bacterium]MBT3837453.1 RNA pyrophosphohydrolase [Thiotrichales bacterium]MBT4151436.1 RNA pyrophosphohydrolase [Thiotrichales bacterium]